SILILGAGELGMAMLRAFSMRNEPSWEITVLLRPETANLPQQAPKIAPIYALPGDVKILPCDLLESSQSELASEFKRFDVIVGCTGYDQNSAGTGAGLQRKIANAVLEAETVKLYLPWQFGVEYDLFGHGDAGGLFDEQKDIRKLLREAVASGRTKTEWIIVSTGIFMSYLFSSFWGVVTRSDNGDGWVVNALGSWDVSTTVTTPEDIGTATAEIVYTALTDTPEGNELKNRAVYIAGDTVSYAQLINIVRDATGQPTRKGEELKIPLLEERMKQKPEDILNKYRVAFGRGKGVSWDKASTFTHKHGISVQDARSWAADHLRA
ncbi:hypothetical protein NA57DRAFT_25285, partial [Rhizodiscina lignyota]